MTTLAARLKKSWTEAPTSHFETTTLGDLKVGQLFIFLPSPGDNEGHGGFKGPYHIFIKRNERVMTTENGLKYHPDSPHCRCVRFCDEVVCDEPLHMPVLPIQ